MGCEGEGADGAVEAGGGADGELHCEMSSMGKGKMMVEFFSALIEFRVCR